MVVGARVPASMILALMLGSFKYLQMWLHLCVAKNLCTSMTLKRERERGNGPYSKFHFISLKRRDERGGVGVRRTFQIRALPCFLFQSQCPLGCESVGPCKDH